MKTILVGLTLVLGALAASLGAADLAPYKEGEQARIDHPIKALLSDQKTVLVFLLTFGSTIPGLAIARGEARKRKNDQKDLIIKYLQHIHTRSFPHSSGGMSDKHRVSLFVARSRRYGLLWRQKKRQLECIHRTDSSAPRRAWDLSERQGLVVSAWLYQATLSVDPPSGAPEDVDRYLREACMTADIQKERSWPNAGMNAVPLLIGGVEPLAILLVESNGPQNACSELTWDAKTLAMLLGEG